MKKKKCKIKKGGGGENMKHEDIREKKNYSSLNIRQAFYIPVTQYVKPTNDSIRNWIQNP